MHTVYGCSCDEELVLMYSPYITGTATSSSAYSISFAHKIPSGYFFLVYLLWTYESYKLNSVNDKFSNRKSPPLNLGNLSFILNIQELYILH